MIRRFKNHKRKKKKNKKKTGEVNCLILVFTEKKKKKKQKTFPFNSFYFCKKQTFIGLPWWLSGKESACQCRRHRRRGFNPCIRKIPWGREWKPAPVFLPGESHGQRSLAGYNPQGQNESDTT